MNLEETEKIINSLIDTFILSGNVSLDLRNKGLKKKIKSDNTPVTNGDIEVNNLLINKISNLTPNIKIVSEENLTNKENKNLKNFWLIDPIDGTKDYIKKKDEYTLNAALIVNLKPAAGIIYAPAKDRLFFSYGKKFAYEIFNGKTKELNCNKINTNKIIGLENSNNTPDEILEIYKKYKVSDRIKMSSSLKFCTLASGEADIYAAQARAYEWDIAAGHTILVHAGGFVTTFDEKEFLYGKENYKNLTIIAKRSSDLKN